MYKFLNLNSMRTELPECIAEIIMYRNTLNGDDFLQNSRESKHDEFSVGMRSVLEDCAEMDL
jgi:hypothetical protein